MADEILSGLQRPVIPPRAYRVEDFGAVGDGQTDDRAAIQKTINVANREGGGRILLGFGKTYFCAGSLVLKSHCEVHLPENSRICFSSDPDDYTPLVLTRWEGTECFNYSPMIYAYQAENIALTGSGCIEGGDEIFREWRPLEKKHNKALREMGKAGVPLSQRVFGPGHYLRPSLVQFFGCQRVLLEGLSLRKSPFWMVHLVSCLEVTATGLDLESENLNNDGIDIESSGHVLVEKCRFQTGDDCIVIKSGRDEEGWRLGRPSQSILIRKNHISGHNALSIGSEMSGGVRKVLMTDNTLEKVRSALYFKSSTYRGGVVEDVSIKNTTVGHSEKGLIRFVTNYQGQSDGQNFPVFRNFTIEDLKAREVGEVFEIKGHPQEPIRDVTIRRVEVENLTGQRDITDQDLCLAVAQNYAERITLEEVTLAGKPIRVVE
ncbi:MAG: glycoside hydrolase family 28 protein [Opitutales bacterium]|nr:glycoside hydrolase family 28 protein [Opitutales bacterium]